MESLVLAQDVGGGDFDLGTIFLYILIGLVVGALARLVVPNTGGMSLVLTIVLGIIGALVGGYLAGAVWADTAGVDWIASILVAAILVFIASRMGSTRTTA
ncbi:MAG: GlsB/YeaQ/YmgE family stress response membrane protein [Acidimicrobiia bacterium]